MKQTPITVIYARPCVHVIPNQQRWFFNTMRSEKKALWLECVYMCVTNMLDKQGVTAWVCGVEADVAPILLPVLYILKYTNVFTRVNRIYYRSRLIFLICVEKISIYKAHFAVKWGRKCKNETEMRQDERAQERERTTKNRKREREREGEGRRSALKSLCIHGGFWSCEMSSHRSQESDKLGKKLYFASRAAKSIKVMPSAYININDTCTHTHTRAHRTGEMGENRRDVLMGLLLLLLLLPHSEKWKDKKKK